MRDRERRRGGAACDAASDTAGRGTVGAGTGCTVGKLLGAEHWTKGGFGLASAELPGGGLVSAMAVVNAVGDVLEADGSVLAGIRRGDGYVPSEDVIAAGAAIRRPWRDATTLVCVVTDVVLTKTEAWMCARAANAGVARAVSPVWTPFDGDTVFCASTCRVDGDPLAVSLLAAAVVAEAIRDGVREATAAPGCPAAVRPLTASGPWTRSHTIVTFASHPRACFAGTIERGWWAGVPRATRPQRVSALDWAEWPAGA